MGFEKELEKYDIGVKNIDDICTKLAANNILDEDLRELDVVSKITGKTIAAGTKKILVQISKVSDISKPKGPEGEEEFDAPGSRLLLLSVTDGSSRFFAMEKETCSDIRLDLAPGSKLVLGDGKNDITFRNSIYLLRPGNYTLLKGRVESMYTPWKLARDFSSATDQQRNVVGKGQSLAPRFAKFDGKTDSLLPLSQAMPSLQTLVPSSKEATGPRFDLGDLGHASSPSVLPSKQTDKDSPSRALPTIDPESLRGDRRGRGGRGRPRVPDAEGSSRPEGESPAAGPKGGRGGRGRGSPRGRGRGRGRGGGGRGGRGN